MSKKFNRKIAAMVMATSLAATTVPAQVIQNQESVNENIKIPNIVEVTTGSHIQIETTTGSMIEVNPVTEIAGNLINNFSFEEVTDTPKGLWVSTNGAMEWEAKPHYNQPNAVTMPDVTLDNEHKISGNYSVKFEAKTATNRGYIIQTIDVKPNQMYELGAWIKAEKINGERFGIQIIELDANNKALSTNADETTRIKVNEQTHDWKAYNTVIETASTTKKLQVKLFLGPGYQPQKGATAWVDDLFITEYTPQITPVESVTLPERMVIELGTTETLLPMIQPTLATNKEVTWESADDSIVTIDDKGVLTAKQVGETTVTVTTKEGGFTATCQVAVKEDTNKGLIPNGSFEFTVQAKDDGKQNIWENGVAPKAWANLFVPSGNKGQVFEVDTQVAYEGEQSIRMSSNDSTARTAFNNTLTGIEDYKTYELSFKAKTEKVVGKGVYLRTQYFGKSGKLADGPSTEKITGTTDWTTYSVMFKDMPAGTTRVVVDIFLEEATGNAWIDDLQLKETYNFSLNSAEENLNVGDTVQLKAIFTPEDVVPDKTVVWESSNSQVVTVDADGLIEAVGPGVATITGTTKDGYEAVCKVAVDDPALLPYYAQMRDKWSNRLTLNNISDKSDQDYINNMQSLTESAQELWDTMEKFDKESGVDNRKELWSKYDTTKVSAQLSYTFNNIRTMAKAYASDGSGLYKNEALKEDILDALDWVYDNRYHENFGKIYDNWYHWCIAIPQTLGDTLVLMYDELRPGQLEKELKTMDRFNPTPQVAVGIYDNVIVMTGANLLDKAVVSSLTGMLGNTSKHLFEARDAISEVLPYVTEGDGFYEDGSFVQHESIPYAGGYGGVLMKGLSEILFMTDTTPFEVVDSEIENVYDWILNAFQPLYYKGAIMDMVSGRGIARPGQSDHTRGKGLLTRMLALAETAPQDKQFTIKSYIKESIANDTVCENYFAGMNINDVIAVKELLADASIPARGDLKLHKVYGAMDRVVHHRPGFTLGISMYSDRISHFEFGNGENKKGWHTASGMTYLYNDDVNQFGGDFWATVDMMRLPGITTDHTDGTVKDWYKYYSKESWVGGSSINDLYGATGMAFDMERSGLTGKKSWFSFDDEIVALGIGIESSDQRAVETIVENRKIKADGSNAVIIDGKEYVSELNTEENLENPTWAYLGGNTEAGTDSIGYYFPSGGNVKVLKESRTSSWNTVNDNGSTDEVTDNYVSLAVQHGVAPQGEDYSYVLLPNKTANEIETYSQNADVQILSNTEDVQAVRENKLGVVGINFWNPASVEYITAKNPCSVMIEEGKQTLSLGISDPTHQSKEVKVVLDKADYEVTSKDNTVSVKEMGDQIEITVKTDKSMGKTHKVELASNKPVGISLDKTSISLKKGKSEIVKVNVLPELAEIDGLVWQSSDEKVASVIDHKDGTATINALKKGEAVITVRTADGSLEASCKVTVRNNDNGQGNQNPDNQVNKPSSNKEKELVEKVNNLSAADKETFKTVLVNEIPYTTLKSDGQIVNNKLPKEVVEMLNKNPQLLAEMGIDLTDYMETVVLQPIQDVTFKDVKTSHWAYNSIKQAAELGIVKGYPQGTFKPNGELALEDALTFLDRVLLLNEKVEMKLSREVVEKYVTNQTHWAFNHVASVASKLAEGTLKEVMTDQSQPITREVLAQVIYEINGSKRVEKVGLKFTDLEKSKYQDALLYCIAEGILQGTNETELAPQKVLTRAELMTVLIRLNAKLK